MRAFLVFAIILGAAAPALADPAPGVTVTYQYNSRPGPLAITGADGTATLPVDVPGVYDVMVGEPADADLVLYASAGGSEAQVTLPRGTLVNTRVLRFRLAPDETITVRVEREASAPAE